MPSVRHWVKRRLPHKTVDALRTVRHASSQALTGADMFHLRVELEQRIDERLRATDAAQDQRIMAAVRALLLDEMDRWAADVIERVELRLAASARRSARLDERALSVTRPAVAANGDGLQRSGAATPSTIVAHNEVAG